MKTAAVLIVYFLISCSSQNRPAGKQAPPFAAGTNMNYDSCKKVIAAIKNQYRPAWKKLPGTDKERIFTRAIAQTIVPVWIGTPWSFNGTSETPQQGSIACGYFVTTVLRDAGIDIARVKLAQCASEQMIRALVQPKYIHRYSNLPADYLITSIRQQGYGLYIIGLDNHTGFIYNDGEEVYFIHSTYIGTRDVQYEKAATSKVLQWSKYKVTGKLSADEKVLAKWIN